MEPNSNNNNTEAIAGSSDRIGNDGLEMASETIGVSAPETKVEASTGPAPVSENSNASISTAQPTSVLGNGETTGTVPMVTADNKVRTIILVCQLGDMNCLCTGTRQKTLYYYRIAG